MSDETDAIAFRGLKQLCGYYQDGSQTTVKIHQDDATNNFILEVEKKTYYGRSLEQAITMACTEEIRHGSR